MTNEMRLQTELSHLLDLLDPPLPAWSEFVERKANALAAMNPDVYQALPEMLRAAMQTISKPSIPTHDSTDRKEN